VPRGVAALGYAQYLPKEKYIQRTEELLDRMCMTMGGRAAEKLIYNKISTGAQSDLDSATKTAYAMVVVYGMSEKIGNVSYYDMLEKNTFQRPYSDNTATIIDEEVKSIIDGQYARAIELLRDKEAELHILAKALLEKEVLFKDDLEKLFGKRPFESVAGHFDQVTTKPPVEATSEEEVPQTDAETIEVENNVSKDETTTEA
jgi:cell division protease FtsH